MSSTPSEDAGDSAPAKNNTSDQPSILNIKSMDVNTMMRVESDVLEPLTFSQSEAVWELQPKGFLHPNSAITIGFDVNPAVARAFPYSNVGIHSLVRRAVLRTTAGRVINDTDDWNNLQGIRSMFVNNSTNKEREQYLTGRSVDFEIEYDTGSSVTSEHGYGLSNGNEVNKASAGAVAGSGIQGLSVPPILLNKAQPEFQIKLHDLFNYCKAGNQLPLFLLPNERIQVVLYWAEPTGAKRLAMSSQDNGNSAQPFTINKDLCKFIADYTFYDGDIMDKFRGEYEKGLTFAYTDYRLSKQSVSKATALNNVRNIGGNGMVVDSVLWQYGLAKTALDALTLLGSFTAYSPLARVGAGVTDTNILTSNLFINSEFIYPQSVTNSARQFHNLKEAEGMVPFVSRALYGRQGPEGLTDNADHQLEGREISGALAGRFFNQGFRTSGLSTRIDNRGIDLHTDAIMDDLAFDQRAYLEIKRYAIISDGHLETYFI